MKSKAIVCVDCPAASQVVLFQEVHRYEDGVTGVLGRWKGPSGWYLQWGQDTRGSDALYCCPGCIAWQVDLDYWLSMG